MTPRFPWQKSGVDDDTQGAGGKRKLKSIASLNALRPRSGYSFHSDYIKVDDSYCTVMSFYHPEGAQTSFPAFWGVNRVPSGLDETVTVHVLDTVSRKSKDWVEKFDTKSERVNRINQGNADEGGTSQKIQQKRINQELFDVKNSLQQGNAYLKIQMRLLVQAPTLEILDQAVAEIEKQYIRRFSTLKVASRHGLQRKGMEEIFKNNDLKEKTAFYMPSDMYAGAYSLVTNGINDDDGEYVGYMYGDLNTSANQLNVNNYRSHVVVASSERNERVGNQLVADMWGSKLSQSCLLHNGRVVHLVLNGADLMKLGPAMANITARVDMNRGEVNMLEVFGDVEDTQKLFGPHLDKIVLMTHLLQANEGENKSVVEGFLKTLLTKFYIYKNMWIENAAANVDRLRLVNLNHFDVPTLHEFQSFLDVARAEHSQEGGDVDLRAAALKLSMVFKNLLESYGDLFNVHTAPSFDATGGAARVIYDFNAVRLRDEAVAMAQLVNVLSYAVHSLGVGDSLIIHGAEYLRGDVKAYVQRQLELLQERGGRVVWLFGSVEAALDHADYVKLDKASYSLLGRMTSGEVDVYQQAIGDTLPVDLIQLVTGDDEGMTFFRRGKNNVAFRYDILLGLNPEREYARRKKAGVLASTEGAQQGFGSRDTSAVTQEPKRTEARVIQTKGYDATDVAVAGPAVSLTKKKKKTVKKSLMG